jgi:hypothetical protein
MPLRSRASSIQENALLCGSPLLEPCNRNAVLWPLGPLPTPGSCATISPSSCTVIKGLPFSRPQGEFGKWHPDWGRETCFYIVEYLMARLNRKCSFSHFREDFREGVENRDRCTLRSSRHPHFGYVCSTLPIRQDLPINSAGESGNGNMFF